LKEEALDRTLWGKVFGRDNVAAVRLIKEWWYYCIYYILSVESFIYFIFVFLGTLVHLTLHVYF
jgi:hypothetical protein